MFIRLHKPKRLTAGLLHFGISLGVFLFILILLVNFWYPETYFNDSGGWQGIKIVASIDVVLGPLMTLIVFNPKKSISELTIDIGIIASMQICALLWGVYTLHNQRPVAVVFWESNFMSIPARALYGQNYPLDKITALSDAHPPLIYAEKPTKLADLKKMLELITKEKIPPHQQTWLYRSLKDHFADIKPQQLNIDRIIAKHPEVKNKLSSILQKNNQSIHDVLYFLLQSKYGNSVLIFDQKANYLGYINPN